MNTTENLSEPLSRGPLLEKDAGYYYSSTVNCSPEVAYNFCQGEENVKKVLTNLPDVFENFLDLNLSNKEQLNQNEYKIVWQNRPDSKTQGTLTFLIKKAPADRGTFITAEAQFEKLSFKEDGPSTIINLFLQRMKALLETGEVPTTKGQPSGREELKTYH